MTTGDPIAAPPRPEPAGGDGVTLDLTRDGVAVVRLSRPEVKNAFNPEVIARLSDIFDELRGADGVRVVLVEGDGGAFSAGADLSWMKAAADYTHDENLEDAQALGEMLRRFRALPQPSVSVIDGPAMGGGVGLVAVSDIALATERSFFAFSEVRLGLVAGTISPYVVEALGVRAARRWLLTGSRFSAAEAYRIGLVHDVVADRGALAEASEAVVGAIMASSPAAVRMSKEMAAAMAGRPIAADVIARSCRYIADARAGDDAREGLAAFFERRKPSWAP